MVAGFEFQEQRFLPRDTLLRSKLSSLLTHKEMARGPWAMTGIKSSTKARAHPHMSHSGLMWPFSEQSS